jgi:hypothetical protein
MKKNKTNCFEHPDAQSPRLITSRRPAREWAGFSFLHATSVACYLRLSPPSQFTAPPPPPTPLAYPFRPDYWGLWGQYRGCKLGDNGGNFAKFVGKMGQFDGIRRLIFQRYCVMDESGKNGKAIFPKLHKEGSSVKCNFAVFVKNSSQLLSFIEYLSNRYRFTVHPFNSIVVVVLVYEGDDQALREAVKSGIVIIPQQQEVKWHAS